MNQGRNAGSYPPGGGPSITAPGLLDAVPGHVLTAEHRAQIAAIASVVRFQSRETHIVGFLFADDLFGLAQDGRYVNSAEAVAAVTAYRIPVTALEPRLRTDHGLEFPVICKLCHELPMAQHHAFLASRRRGPAKVALFHSNDCRPCGRPG